MPEHDKIRSTVSNELIAHRAILFDLVIKGRPGRFRLCITVDKAGGISVAECAAISRDLSRSPELIAELGPDFEREVSSPGVDRPLTTEIEFQAKLGRLLDIDYMTEGRKMRAKGKLLAVHADGIEMELGGERRLVPFSKILRAVQSLPW